MMCQSYIAQNKQSTMPTESSTIGNCSTPVVVEDSAGAATKKLTQHVALLLNVIRSQRWNAFETIALSNPNVFSMIWTAMPQYDDRSSSLLHTIIQYGAPLEVLLKLIQALPKNQVRDALQARDNAGRTPLHVASVCGASPMILKVLAAAEPTTCTALDQDGRTPLHLACDRSSCGTDNESASTASVSIDAVRALLSESLSASLIEDKDDMSALEYAIFSDASLEAVNLLQKASVKCLKEKNDETEQIIEGQKNNTSSSSLLLSVAPSMSNKRRIGTDEECYTRRVRRVSDCRK